MSTGSPFFGWFRRFIDDGIARDLSLSELLTTLVLLRHSNRDLKAWPGASRIAELTALSPASTYRALERLHRRGLVESKEEQVKGGRGRMYRVRVFHLCLPEAARSHQREHAAGHVLTRDTRELSTTSTEVPMEQPRVPTAPVREMRNGERPTALNGDGLRELIVEWMQRHPSDEPLEQRAKDCAYVLQHRGIQTWIRQVLETMQALQVGQEVVTRG